MSHIVVVVVVVMLGREDLEFKLGIGRSLPSKTQQTSRAKQYTGKEDNSNMYALSTTQILVLGTKYQVPYMYIN